MPSKQSTSDIYDEPLNGVVLPAQPTTPQQQRDSKVIVALLGLQTIVLLMLLGGGTMAYRHFDAKADKIDAVVTVIENPSSMLNQPQLVQSLVTLLQNTTSDFFFGSQYGSVPSFLTNVMGTDFGSLAGSVADLANKVVAAYEVNNGNSLCNQIITCTPNQYVQCSNGATQYCPYYGQVNCAVDSTCVPPSIVTGASLVGSVAGQLRRWSQVQGPNDGTPAFSNGIFRLDVVFEWIRAQMNSTQWQTAGVTCNQFVNQVNNIQWNGTYLDTNGNAVNWDATSSVQQVTTYVQQVCNGMSTLNEYSSADGAAKKGKGAQKKAVAAQRIAKLRGLPSAKNAHAKKP